MVLGTLVSVVVFVLIVVVIWKIVKSIVKALFFAGLVLLVFVLVLGGVVLADAREFQSTFAKEDVLFLLEDQGSVVAGVVFHNAKGEAVATTAEKNVGFSEDLQAEDWDGLVGDYYKVVVMNRVVLDDVPTEEIEKSAGDIITKEDALAVIDSDEAFVVFSKVLYPEQEMNAIILEQFEHTYGSEEELKGTMFHYFVVGLFSTGSAERLVINLKSGDVTVYPESAMFRFIRKVPFSLVQKALQSMRAKGEQAITSAVVGVKEKLRG